MCLEVVLHRLYTQKKQQFQFGFLLETLLKYTESKLKQNLYSSKEKKVYMLLLSLLIIIIIIDRSWDILIPKNVSSL